VQQHADHTSASGFLPHGFCYLWDTSLLALHVGSDLLIGAAYVAISIALAVLVHRLRANIPFSTVFVAFGLFIIACGLTHFVEVWTLWVPVYWFAGSVKAVTAAASVATAIAMPFTVPRVIGTVRDAGLAREREVRAARSDALEERNAQLVALTSELSAVNEQLREALAVAEQERGRAEEARLVAADARARAEAAASDAEHARSRAEEANRIKADFLRTMSHELRTPLNAIGGYVELLELGIRGPVTSAQRDDLNRIRRAQHHLLGIITDILTYARIEAGALEYRSEAVSLEKVCEDVTALIRPQMTARQQELIVALERPHELVVRADNAKIAQVLLNLLSNAHKYTPAGGRAIIQGFRKDDRVILVVADTGPGIPAQREDAVFEPFVQVSGGIARPHDGTGLGLAISRDMVRAMKGELGIANDDLRRATDALGFPGAAFVVELPAYNEHVAQ
jgi:signal transduction histidine kinase